MPLRRSASVVVVAVAVSAFGTPASLGPALASTHVAASALGDLARFRAIVADTLAFVNRGDIAGARTRVKDLETAWDKDEPTLKARDKAAWTALDGMIDSALTDLRIPNPKPAACVASLKALLSKLDGLDRA
jgi:ABC-type tungstate transport system permease subunit